MRAFMTPTGSAPCLTSIRGMIDVDDCAGATRVVSLHTAVNYFLTGRELAAQGPRTRNAMSIEFRLIQTACWQKFW